MSTVMDPPAGVAMPTPLNGSQRLYTPDDLLKMPDQSRFELVDGELSERNMGAESSLVGLKIMVVVSTFANKHVPGYTFQSDCGYQIHPRKPNQVRYPDGSFIRADRLSEIPKGFIRIIPDMLLEVVSPNDLAYELQEKIEEYQECQVPLIWVAYPPSRSIHVYRLGKHPVRLGPDDTLTGDDVLPGFSCKVADLFPPVPTPAPQS